jgi:hypothetical protein
MNLALEEAPWSWVRPAPPGQIQVRMSKRLRAHDKERQLKRSRGHLKSYRVIAASIEANFHLFD